MRLRILVAPLLVALAVAGCGTSGGEDDGVATAGNGTSASANPTPSMDEAERSQKFAQCMREQGVEVPDAEEGRIQIRGPEAGGPAPTEVNEAMAKCKQFMPNGGEPPKLSPEEIEQARKYSVCMRENGVPNFPDPSDNGGVQISSDLGIKLDDPKFKAAEEACRDLAPKRGERRTQNNGGEQG